MDSFENLNNILNNKYYIDKHIYKIDNNKYKIIITHYKTFHKIYLYANTEVKAKQLSNIFNKIYNYKYIDFIQIY